MFMYSQALQAQVKSKKKLSKEAAPTIHKSKKEFIKVAQEWVTVPYGIAIKWVYVATQYYDAKTNTFSPNSDICQINLDVASSSPLWVWLSFPPALAGRAPSL